MAEGCGWTLVSGFGRRSRAFVTRIESIDPVAVHGSAPRGALDSCGQATKGAWGMSWRQEALKGVEVCEMPGGVDKRALIPGFPNWRALNP